MAKQSKGKTALILIGTMIGLLLGSLDSNIVGTAMPKIIGSLNGMSLYTWPVTAYLLTMTIFMPLSGKLTDLYGFKPVYLLGIVVFLAGSVLCGVSQTMMEFILFRGLQGLGGAILLSTPITIISILFPPAERAKYGSIVAAASGLSGLIGPFLGGVITDHMSWRWIFFVNIPLGIIALIIVLAAFPAYREKRENKRIDFGGAAALVAALVPLLLAFSWGGRTYAWGSAEIIGMFAFSAVMLVVFGVVETKAQDPIMPMSLFKNGVFSFTVIEFFMLNAVLMACIIFIPLFLQGVQGTSASSSGAIITPMLVSLMVGVMLSGQIVSRTCRYKTLAAVGVLVMGAGTLLLSFMTAGTGSALTVVSMIVMGLGVGATMAVFNVTAQNVFPENQMGVVSSSVQFFGRMGQTLASSILGTVLSSLLAKGFSTLDVSKFPAQLAQQLKSISTISSADATNAIKAKLPAALLPDFERLLSAIRQALSDSIHHIFVICLVIVAAAFVTVLFMKEVPMKKKFVSETPDGKADDAVADE